MRWLGLAQRDHTAAGAQQQSSRDITLTDLSSLPITQLIRPAYEYDAPPPDTNDRSGGGVYSGGDRSTGAAGMQTPPRGGGGGGMGGFSRPSSRGSAGGDAGAGGGARPLSRTLSRGASRQSRRSPSRGSRRPRSRGFSRGSALGGSGSLVVAPQRPIPKQLHLVVANSCPALPADVYLTRSEGSKVTTVELPPGYRVNLTPSGPVDPSAIAGGGTDPTLVPHVTRPITPSSSTFGSATPSRAGTPTMRGTPNASRSPSRRSSSRLNVVSPELLPRPSSREGGAGAAAAGGGDVEEGASGAGDALDSMLFPGVPLHPSSPSPAQMAGGAGDGAHAEHSEERDNPTPLMVLSRPVTAGSVGFAALPAGVRPTSRGSYGSRASGGMASEDMRPIQNVPTRGIFFDFIPGSETAPLRLPCSETDQVRLPVHTCVYVCVWVCVCLCL